MRCPSCNVEFRVVAIHIPGEAEEKWHTARLCSCKAPVTQMPVDGVQYMPNSTRVFSTKESAS